VLLLSPVRVVQAMPKVSQHQVFLSTVQSLLQLLKPAMQLYLCSFDSLLAGDPILKELSAAEGAILSLLPAGREAASPNPTTSSKVSAKVLLSHFRYHGSLVLPEASALLELVIPLPLVWEGDAVTKDHLPAFGYSGIDSPTSLPPAPKPKHPAPQSPNPQKLLLAVSTALLLHSIAGSCMCSGKDVGTGG